MRIAFYDDCIKKHDHRITIIETRSVVWTTVIGLFFTILSIALKFWKV